jgi:transposase-like protein
LERKIYTNIFKRQAVDIARESKNITATARTFSITPKTLRKWMEKILHTESDTVQVSIEPKLESPDDISEVILSHLEQILKRLGALEQQKSTTVISESIPPLIETGMIGIRESVSEQLENFNSTIRFMNRRISDLELLVDKLSSRSQVR